MVTRVAVADMSPDTAIPWRNANAQVRIFDDILDLSRIIAGKLRLDLQPTDLVSVVTEAVEVVRPSVAAKSLSTKSTCRQSPSCSLPIRWGRTASSRSSPDTGRSASRPVARSVRVLEELFMTRAVGLARRRIVGARS